MCIQIYGNNRRLTLMYSFSAANLIETEIKGLKKRFQNFYFGLLGTKLLIIPLFFHKYKTN